VKAPTPAPPFLPFPSCPEPLVSIVIPVHNQWEFTYRCLRSLLAAGRGTPYEVILADDDSDDETAELPRFAQNVRIVRDGVRRGFLGNCNRGASAARGDYLVMLNNDTTVELGWLEPLLGVLERDPSVGLVGPKLVYPDGRLQEAGGIIWRDASGWNYGRGDSPEEPEYNYVKEVDYVSGACLMIRNRLWTEIGGFDERFAPAYYEDADLAFEVRALGFKVVYQPLSVTVHFEGASHGRDPETGVKQNQVRNREVFAEKWKDVLAREHYAPGRRVFRARDRGRDRRNVLVVDHYVPHYDRDAGSRCTFQYLRLLRELGFGVVFLGSNFARDEPYTTELQQLGIHVLYGHRCAREIDDWLRRYGLHFDYVCLNRPHVARDYIDLLRRHAPLSRFVYFPVDLHFLRELRGYRTSRDIGNLRQAREWLAVDEEVIRKVDVVHVVSSYEEEVLNAMFPATTVRRIPLFWLDEVPGADPGSFTLRRDILFVGGSGHPPNRNALEWLLAHVVPSLRERVSELRILVVGSWPEPEAAAFQQAGLIMLGSVSDEELTRLYERCRLVVVPLRYGAGVKGKIVEALCHGVPVVTTAIGAEGLPGVEEHVALADDPPQFAESIVRIYQDEDLWRRLAASSASYAATEFSRARAAEVIAFDFEPARSGEELLSPHA